MKKLGLALIGTLLSTNAMADLILCNDATDYDYVRYSYGVIQDKNDGIETEGWFQISANTCHTLLFGDLNKSDYNTIFMKAYSSKNNKLSELKNNGKTYKLCINESNNFLYKNSSESVRCTESGGVMVDYYSAKYDNQSKHDIIRIQNK